MGEMADYALDLAFDYEVLDTSLNYERENETGYTCKYCGEGFLRWTHIEGKGWRLFNPRTNKVHTCKEYKKGLL